jgi:hypothetical protein
VQQGADDREKLGAGDRLAQEGVGAGGADVGSSSGIERLEFSLLSSLIKYLIGQ